MGLPSEVAIRIEYLECGGCGVTFGIPSSLYTQYNNNGISVRCPNPNCRWPSMHRTESEVAKLKKQLESAQQSRRWAEESLENERKSHTATKGNLTKLKKRVHNGVCPCCKRSFQNLARHMKGKHPDYPESEIS